MKLKAVIAVSVLAIAAATGGWMYYRYESAPKNLELYGNVDIRQVNLAFLWPERIKSILVEEGDFVKAGQPVAEQETDTLKIEIEQAKAFCRSGGRTLPRLDALRRIPRHAF